MKTICIVFPQKNLYSMTFVYAHIERLERLSARIVEVHGKWIPHSIKYRKGQPSLPGVARHTAHLTRHAVLATRLYWLLRQQHVDVVLAESGPIGVSIMKLCQRAGVPLVVHFHGIDAYGHALLSTYGTEYPALFQAAQAIIAVSRDMEHQLRALGAPPEKLHYNPYGVDPSLFIQSQPADNPPCFVAVGRFVDKKGPHLTLLAFRKVLDACPEARLVMIGDGPLWEACKLLSRALNMEDQVTFAGVQSHAEVARSMHSARAFVQHSIRPGDGDSEGTPVAILEAGMSGLPVVSTRHAGIKDVVIHNETGFLVDEGDIDGMAACMLLLARDAAQAATLGARAHHHIRTNFSMDQHIARLSAILEQAHTPTKEQQP